MDLKSHTFSFGRTGPDTEMDSTIAGFDLSIDFGRYAKDAMSSGETETESDTSSVQMTYTLADPDARDYLDIRMMRDPVRVWRVC